MRSSLPSAANDMDFGSAGILHGVLPASAGSFPEEVVIAGKGGNPCDASGFAWIYLLNQNSLGEFNANQDQIVQEIQAIKRRLLEQSGLIGKDPWRPISIQQVPAAAS